jgi:hypothetical protein
MADDQSKQQDQPNQHIDTTIPERPLDPTRNAQDMFGDTSGMTGVTQGGLQQSSAEPSDTLQDTTEIHGGVIQNPTHPSPTGYTKSEVGSDEYKQAVQQGMSNEARNNVTDVATEPSQTDQTANANPDPVSPQDITLTQGGDSGNTQAPDTAHAMNTGVSTAMGDQDGSRFVNTQDAPYKDPESTGEEDAAGGTTPDVRTDDDTLEMAQRAGMQPDEDPEHPKPVDIARDVDNAEERIKKS